MINFCTKCGQKIAQNDKFCTGCGDALKSASTGTSTGVAPAKSTGILSKFSALALPVKIAAVCGIVTVSVLIGLMLGGVFGNPNNKPPATEAPQVEGQSSNNDSLSNTPPSGAESESDINNNDKTGTDNSQNLIEVPHPYAVALEEFFINAGNESYAYLTSIQGYDGEAVFAFNALDEWGDSGHIGNYKLLYMYNGNLHVYDIEGYYWKYFLLSENNYFIQVDEYWDYNVCIVEDGLLTFASASFWQDPWDGGYEYNGDEITESEYDKLLEKYGLNCSVDSETSICSCYRPDDTDKILAMTIAKDMNESGDNVYDIDIWPFVFNVEYEIYGIRDIWTQSRNVIDNGTLKPSGSNTIKNYTINDRTTMIEISSGVNNISYSRIYSFYDGQLIFAFWSGDDQHRLYFKNERLFRWRHTSASGTTTDYDNRHDLAEYSEWEQRALQDAYMD